MIQKLRNNLVLIIYTILFTGCSDAQLSEQMVIATEEDRYAAIIARDTEGLSRYLADEFVYHQPTGDVADKSRYIKNVEAANPAILTAEFLELEVQVYDSFATATGRTALKVDFGGEERDATLRFLNVWILRDGRLQLTARQSAFE